MNSVTKKEAVPDRPFHKLEALKSVARRSELLEILRPPDYKALKLQKGRSGDSE